MQSFVTAKELAKILGISMPNAYARIRELNEELKQAGYQTFPGKLPIAYAKKKFYGIDFDSIEISQHTGIAEVEN